MGTTLTNRAFMAIMHSRWLIALVALSVALVIQTNRYRSVAEALARTEARERQLSDENLAFTRSTLRRMQESVRALPGHSCANDGLYVKIDITCPACSRAVETLRTRSSLERVWVMSATDSPAELDRWIGRDNGILTVARGAFAAAISREMPDGITPVFVEVSNGEPIDL